PEVMADDGDRGALRLVLGGAEDGAQGGLHLHHREEARAGVGDGEPFGLAPARQVGAGGDVDGDVLEGAALALVGEELALGGAQRFPAAATARRRQGVSASLSAGGQRFRDCSAWRAAALI